MYNGHRKSSAKGDFISLALVNGVPEFRFNLGQGITTIKGDKQLTLGQWHTIKISRNRKRGINIFSLKNRNRSLISLKSIFRNNVC